MAKSLSVDLRQRVSAASAIRWRDRQKKAGIFTPRKQGGDRRSQRIEENAQFILDAVAAKSDITLVELRGKLMEHGVTAGVATRWRFFKRWKITLKKDGARRRTTTRRCERGPRGVVRRATRSRSRSPCLHRRDRSQHIDGADLRAFPTR